ncbi:hypothetical protein DICPUDRAFT_152102 [Dictyostelium purpureum]|uniref:J domain-containing protein n=1 Tax=Dictyostelium purpureum TaxID=5786 RepID=F0ZKH5_DICPU|nr:uncharacterized protein DICPUDRAFT_152102 [Dictyostelium purpureum]EGC35555.1 hypothetical protein DICPUDRAFT_152102 [Dictyostelium purpureum]|eukprot:XP_003287926.1 hypothetical protein DICPUDRAFT_152102 [Dictyostelium purpureum]
MDGTTGGVEDAADDFLHFFDNEDPYKILRCNKGDSVETVTKKYKKLVSKVKAQEIVDKKELKRLEIAYRILTDQNYKELYDLSVSTPNLRNKLQQQHQQQQQQQQQQIPSIKKSLINSGLSLIAYGVNSTLIRVQANKSIVSSKEVAKEIYRKRGVGGFFRGIVFSVLVVPAETIRYALVDYTARGIFSLLRVKTKEYLIDLAHHVSRVVCLFPIYIAFDYILMAPLQMKTMDILKQTILKRENGYHNFFYYLGLSIASKILRDTVNQIGKYIYSVQQKHPKNASLYYLEMAYNNNITKALLHSVLCCPILCVRSQYPYSVINSISNGIKAKPLDLNPIQIAEQIYNQHGYSKFYNGFWLLFCSKLLTKMALFPIDSIHQIETIFE